MCGFVALLKKEAGFLNDEDQQNFKLRNQMISHRGPDDEGYYEDEDIFLGFSRLSIIDVSGGRQPLNFLDRYHIIFNGEVYNYLELRDDLIQKGYTFHTDTDTEVVVALFDHLRERSFAQLRGMFSLLIWDAFEQILYGARDPFGIKPMYYSEKEDGMYFASESKSIGKIEKEICLLSLQHYLSFQYVPEPNTLDPSIKKLQPGHYFVQKKGDDIKTHLYFQATFKVNNDFAHKHVETVRQVLYDSVEMHMRSDVPVGAFLSGGIDSTIITSMAKKFHPNIKTFSVGFLENGYSEIDVAKETADALGIENYAYYISPDEFVAKIPKIMYHLDDPLADPAAVGLYFVAREARKQVTVVLSGEGADELFGGYNIYREPNDLKMFNHMPQLLKSALLAIVKLIPDGVKGKSFIERGTTPLCERYIGNAKIFNEVEKEKVFAHYSQDVHNQLITGPLFDQVATQPLVNQMQFIDINTWLTGDILLKADRLTMAHGLELRVPFLDVEVFKVARKISVDLKIANQTTKFILRKAAEGIVPNHVLNRKKLGFPVPIKHWLKDELYDWAKALIDDPSTDMYFHKNVLKEMLLKHRRGKGDYSRKLFTVLMFTVWHQVFIEEKYDLQMLKDEDKVVSKIYENKQS